MAETKTDFNTATDKPITVKEDNLKKYTQVMTEDTEESENLYPPQRQVVEEVDRVVETQQSGKPHELSEENYEEIDYGDEGEVYDDADPSLNYEEADESYDDHPSYTSNAASRKRPLTQEDEESESEAEFMDRRENGAF